jgi:hypothetical protein
MSEILYVVLVGLVLKHFVADFLTQTGWMIGGKGQFSHLGGYIHAMIHAFGTIIVLFVAGLGVTFVLLVALGEFALHYLIDYWKEHVSEDVDPKTQPHKFWALFGLDQTLHSLTYVGIVLFVDLYGTGVA